MEAEDGGSKRGMKMTEVGHAGPMKNGTNTTAGNEGRNASEWAQKEGADSHEPRAQGQG